MRQLVFGAVMCAVTLLPFTTRPTAAAVVVDIVEDGADVLATFDGSMDVTGLTMVPDVLAATGMNPGRAVLSSGGALKRFTGLRGPGAFGTQSRFFFGGTSSGDIFYLFGGLGELGLARDFVSGDAVKGSIRLTGQSFAQLGLVTGVYVYRGPNDTITVNIAPAVVPLPAASGLLLAGLGGLAALRRARR